MSYEVTKIVSGGWPSYTLHTDDLEKALKLMRLQSAEIRREARKDVWVRRQLMFKTYLNSVQGIETALRSDKVLIYGTSNDGGLTRIQIKLSNEAADEKTFDWWLSQMAYMPHDVPGLFFRAQARLFFRDKGLLLPKDLPEVQSYSTASRAYISLADVRRFIFDQPQETIHHLYPSDDLTMMRVFFTGRPAWGFYNGYTDKHLVVST